MKTKALLFDFDGTLLNTNDLIIQTFMYIFDEKFPGQYSTEDCLRFIGPSLKQTFDELTPGETDVMIGKYKEWNAINHDRLVTSYDAVVETLEELHKLGIKMAIVSTKSRESLARGLKVLCAEQFFDVIVGLDDVEHVKPHPEPVLLALQKLGIEKEEAIMIGDNSHDIEGGQNAGVRTAGVAWSAKGVDSLMSYEPTYMLHHMRDLLEIVKGE
ncbi:pyrophosphatase PpaX [Solibacillus kalamii]|uniref:Pyrophosphatase PpaX n=1 Tax=Solibacillus kalamii TaxID=1748298 RepID=A0ABX3ZDH2_9BACL|nr:pyrophosphatase PpaX [Solibacillus kalamii]MBM7666639.1 pyrophosphatase PpaX [Solibacillus kalamii]OUZ37754.1 pyrophosphatase PpaX [Solibacillus kalamii]